MEIMNLEMSNGLHGKNKETIKEMSKEIIKISEDEDRKKSSVIRLLLAEALHNRKKDNKLLN